LKSKGFKDMNRTVLLLILSGAIGITSLNAQTLDKEIPVIAGKLSKTLVAKGRKKVAAIDFVDLQGRPTELGRFLAEQLSVELANAEGISVLDRANIKSILAEHKLTEEGLVKPENAKKLGEFAGVDAILLGTVTSLDDSIILTVKAVSTDTAEVVAAGKVEFRKTSEIQQLSARSVASSSPSASGNSVNPSSDISSTDAAVIVTKDVGDLRIALKDVLLFKARDNGGRDGQGMQWNFEFVNRNLKTTLFVGANGNAHVGSAPGRPRSKLIDSSGNVWIPDGNSTFLVVWACYSTADRIIECLQNGTKANGQVFMGGQLQFFWDGSLGTIEPGQSIKVTMPFVSESAGSEAIEYAQFECELVIGTGTGSRATKYSLTKFMLDKVKMPASKQ
jgi:TolB-like protein